MNFRIRHTITPCVLLSLLLYVLGCSKDSNVLTPPQTPKAATGTVFGKVTYEGGTDFAGITVTLEPLDSSGNTRAVKNIFAMQKNAAGVKLLKSGKSGIGHSVDTIAANMLETITQHDGSYRFEDVPFGRYSLKASKAEKHYAIVQSVSVNDSGPTIVNPVLTPTGTLSGHVVMEGSTDHGGILAYIAGTSYISITNAAGSFAITDVPLGIYTLSVAAPGYPVISKNVSLNSVGSITSVDTIVIKKYGYIFGKVCNYVTGQPISQALVNTMDGDSAWTDQQGIFKIHCASGTARLRISKSDYYIEDIAVDRIATGEITTVAKDILLNRLPFTGESWPHDQIWTSRGDTIKLNIQIPRNSKLTIEAGVVYDGMIHVDGATLQVNGDPKKNVVFINAAGFYAEGEAKVDISYASFQGTGSGARGVIHNGGASLLQNCQFDKSYISCRASQYSTITFLNSSFSGSLDFTNTFGQAEFIGCIFKNVDNTATNKPMFDVDQNANLFVRKSQIVNCRTQDMFRHGSKDVYSRVFLDSNYIADNVIRGSFCQSGGFVWTNNIIENNSTYLGQPFANLSFTQLNGNRIVNNRGFGSGGIVFDWSSKSWGGHNYISFPGIDVSCYLSEGEDVIGDTLCTFSGYTSPENVILSFTHLSTQKTYYAHSVNGKYTDAIIPTGLYNVKAQATGFSDSTLQNFRIAGEHRDYLNFILTKTP